MGETGGAELGHVQLAQEDGPRGLQVRYDRGVFLGHEVIVYGRAAGGPNTRSVELVLDRHRDTVHGTPVFAPGEGLFRLPGGLKRLLAAYGQVGVELVVMGLDALQVGFHRIYGGYFSLLDQIGKLGCGKERYVGFFHAILFYSEVSGSWGGYRHRAVSPGFQTRRTLAVRRRCPMPAGKSGSCSSTAS